MNRRKFVKLFGMSVTIMSIPYGFAQQYKDNPYLIEFNALPKSYHSNGNIIDYAEKSRENEFRLKRKELVNKYSWAVPNDEAIDAIVNFSKEGLIDFGAGSGYWASLIAAKGINVIAVDNWTDSKPDLWFDVQTGSYEYLTFASNRTLMMVWIPQYTDMGITALKRYEGDRLIVIGEPAPARSNANPAFFGELEKNWVLVNIVDIPQWYNHSDGVYFYRKKR